MALHTPTFADIPVEQGGSNEYMRPGETLLSALGGLHEHHRPQVPEPGTPSPMSRSPFSWK